MTTGSVGLDALVENIKEYVSVEVLQRAAKGGPQQVKQTILDQYFQRKWDSGVQAAREGKSEMSERRKSAIRSLFDDWSIHRAVMELPVISEKTSDAVMDRYISGELSGLQARRELRELGYDTELFWDLWAVRDEELRVREHTREAISVYNQAKRKGLSSLLTEDVVSKAKIGFAGLARMRAYKRYLTKKALNRK